ncbi:MAG: pantetheine-phosphate adenylyltransferase [Ignavibacteria bacterium GWA2_55_11]|nr:MAG: pantetheine-phosphate adenylyltransferase [Ignavibacteria bacterium GWA2_55_11]OGU70434.1 MAG: pantetheine-phosphate adenylyltransferase [Ignavibacteria bacterium RIFCSPLOWO2_02_FULL_55_14]OGU72565.1 MAG: pantetheine-phosphate adenylyltransferase [Ignavibacteria bacterium RIFCSPLOWO2_12_FULL_56_21]HAV22180.1 pantetheine-phosphate adenylyltransferase [Bacteroidota bacterium]
MKIAVYPGTFDPITNGHLDILDRAVKLFDKVVISVARNSSKSPLFTDDERLALLQKAVRQHANVEIDSFQGLLVDYARAKKATAIVRGLRVISDFEYEFQMALTNRRLHEEVETVFLMPNEKYTYLSSSIVREIARLGGDVSDFVPKVVLEALKKKLKPS